MWTPGTDPSITKQHVQVTEVGSNPLWQRHLALGGGPSVDFFNYPFELSPPFDNYDLQSGKTYIFQIKSKGLEGTGGWSNEARATIPADPHPSGLNTTVEGNHPNVVLDWAPGTNPKYDEQIVRRREPKQGWVDLASFDVNVSTYTDTTVEAGKKYIYRIAAMRNGKL